MSWHGPPWVYNVWDALQLFNLMIVSFPILGKFSDIISLNMFSGPLSLFSFLDQYNANDGAFDRDPEAS